MCKYIINNNSIKNKAGMRESAVNTGSEDVADEMTVEVSGGRGGGSRGRVGRKETGVAGAQAVRTEWQR